MGVKGLGKIMRFVGFNLILNDKTTRVIGNIRKGKEERGGEGGVKSSETFG